MLNVVVIAGANGAGKSTLAPHSCASRSGFWSTLALTPRGAFATFDRLQIVTVNRILEGERLRLPPVAEVAKRARAKSGGTQLGIFAEG